MSQQFEFGGKIKRYMLIVAVVGLLLGSVLAILQANDAIGLNRFWANILLNTYYFAGISIVGLFFVAAHQLGYGGWQTVFKKVPLAMGKFLYVILGLVIIITLGTVLDFHHLYSHWSIHTDPIVDGKSPFLNKGTYSVLVLGFFGLWALFAFLMNKHFGSTKNWKEYRSTKKFSALFLLMFGVSQSVLSWIFIMSLDPHWYSTLFGWYNFASYACGGFAIMILLLIALKKMGYMPNVTIDHIHDLGKYLFGFSVFWAYLWFSQFMLIWYANIPEATVWFSKRFDVPLFKFIFFAAFLLNFVVPFLSLISRDSKRKYATMTLVAVIVIFGHYLDFFQMVMVEPMAIPHHTEEHHDDEHHEEEHALNSSENVLYAEVAHGDEHDEDHAATESHDDAHVASDAMHSEEEAHDDHGAATAVHGDEGHGDDHHEGELKTYASLGLTELLMFFGFLGLFFFIVLSSLNGKNLEITEDPFLEESLHHHI